MARSKRRGFSLPAYTGAGASEESIGRHRGAASDGKLGEANRVAEVGIGEIREDVRFLVSPRIPFRQSPFQESELFKVRHVTLQKSVGTPAVPETPSPRSTELTAGTADPSSTTKTAKRGEIHFRFF